MFAFRIMGHGLVWWGPSRRFIAALIFIIVIFTREIHLEIDGCLTINRFLSIWSILVIYRTTLSFVVICLVHQGCYDNYTIIGYPRTRQLIGFTNFDDSPR